MTPQVLQRKRRRAAIKKERITRKKAEVGAAACCRAASAAAGAEPVASLRTTRQTAPRPCLHPRGHLHLKCAAVVPECAR